MAESPVRWQPTDESYPPGRAKPASVEEASSEGSGFLSPAMMGLLSAGASIMRNSGWRNTPITAEEQFGYAIPAGVNAYYEQQERDRLQQQQQEQQAQAQAQQQALAQQQAQEAEQNRLQAEAEAEQKKLSANEFNNILLDAKTNKKISGEQQRMWLKQYAEGDQKGAFTAFNKALESKEGKAPTAAMLSYLDEKEAKLSPEQIEENWENRLSSADKYFNPDEMAILRTLPVGSRDKTLTDEVLKKTEKIRTLSPTEALKEKGQEIGDNQLLKLYPNGNWEVIDQTGSQVPSMAEQAESVQKQDNFERVEGRKDNVFGFTKEQAVQRQQNLTKAFEYRKDEDKSARNERIAAQAYTEIRDAVRDGYKTSEILAQAEQFRERMDTEGIRYDKNLDLKKEIFQQQISDSDRKFTEQIRQYNSSAEFKSNESGRNQANIDRSFQQHLVENLQLIEQRGRENGRSDTQIKLAQEKFIEGKAEFALTFGLDVKKYDSGEMRFQATQNHWKDLLERDLAKFDYTKSKDKLLFDRRIVEHKDKLVQWGVTNGIAKENVSLRVTIFETEMDVKKASLDSKTKLDNEYRDNVTKLLNTRSDIPDGVRATVEAELNTNPINAFKTLAKAVSSSGKLMPVPVSILKDYTNGRKIIANVDRIFEMIEKKKGGTKGLGIVGGRIPNWMLNKIAVEVKANIALLSALKRHDLTGVAMSQYEAKLMDHFVPNPTDTLDAIMSKLKAIQDDTSTSLNVLSGLYTNENGYKPLPGKGIGSL